MKSSVLIGNKPTRLPRPWHHEKIIILNYDILPSWYKYLKELRPKLIIVDECQKISNPKNKQTKATIRLSRVCKYAILMSGTPFLNEPIGLWVALNVLRPKIFPSYHGFGLRYTNARFTPWGWLYKGAKNQKELYKKLKTIMIRRLAKKVQKLPPMERHVILVGMNKRPEYAQLMDDFHKWLLLKVRKGSFKLGRMKRALRNAILTRIGYARRFVAENKIMQVSKWIKHKLNTTTSKIIVFGIHKVLLRKLYEEFKYCSVIIDGKVVTSKRDEIINKFDKDRRIRIMFGNMQAAGSGWNGTAATIVAKVEIAWNPGTHSQCEKRAHRFGQTRPVKVYYLVVENTIEEELCKLVQSKQGNISEVLDGKSDGTNRHNPHEVNVFQAFLDSQISRARKKGTLSAKQWDS